MANVAVNILASAAGYALMALGFGLIYNATRFFHFAHGAVYAWAGYATYCATRLCGLPLWAGAVVGVLVAAVVGVACELLAYRPLRQRGASGTVLLIAGLGLYVVLENLLALFFGDQNRSVRTWTLGQAISMGGARVSLGQMLAIGGGVAGYIAATVVLYRTRIGLVVRAAGDDRELAVLAGVDYVRGVLYPFIFGSALAGASAVLRALELDISPGMGFQGLLMGVVAAIVGGIGRIEGAAIGALLIAAAQHLTIWYLSSEWSDAVTFTILAAFVLLRPQGVLGRPVHGTRV